MSVHRFSERNLDYRYYVYSLFCKDSGGAGYVKFGFSRRIDVRITQLRIGCPIPIKMVGLLEVKCEKRQKEVEKALHSRFSDRRLTGEWFGFDYASPQDKIEFNAGCKEVFALHLHPRDDQYWSVINMKELDAYNKERKKAFLSLPRRQRQQVKIAAERNRAITCR